MNRFYLRRHWANQWEAYRLALPGGAQQSREALHRLLLQLWARTRRGWWWRIWGGQPWLSYEIRATERGIDHLWVVPRALGAFVRQELAETYRPGDPEVIDLEPFQLGRTIAGATLRLARPTCYGLSDRVGVGGEIQAALGSLQPGEAVTVQLLLIPQRDSEWKGVAHKAFRKAAQLQADGSTVANVTTQWIDDLLAPVNEFLNLPTTKATIRRDVADAVERAQIKEAPGKLKDHAFEVIARVVATAPQRREAVSRVRAVAAQFAALDDANQVVARRSWMPGRLWRLTERRWPGWSTGSTWTCGELASVVGIPGPRVDRSGSRIVELRERPPAAEITIGYGVYRGERVPVQMSPQALCQHLAIVGKTGAGKGVIQLGVCMDMARKGYGFTWLFPLRRDAYALMAALPEERLKDVIFFEVGHPRWALPLNLLAHDGTEEDQTRVERDAMGLFWRLWSDSWGKSMERYLRAAVIGAAALGGHLGTAEKILTDEYTREKAAGRVANESVRQFLQTFEASPTMLDPAINKLNELLWQDAIACMVAQPDALPWRDVILGRKIVIGSLNQELMGDLPSNLAAGGIVNQLQRVAMSIPPGQRVFHAIGLDEFRTVAGRARDNWETGFSQLRQFNVSLIPAAQYPAQLPETVWRAITGNVGSKIVLREEAEHARTCLELLGSGVSADDLQALPSLQGYANLLLGGKPVGPFTLLAPPFLEPVRDGLDAAEASMARWLRERPGREASRPPRESKVLEVE